jgi:hypothetical protein
MVASMLNCSVAQVKTKRGTVDLTIDQACGQLLHVDRRVPGRVAGAELLDTSVLPNIVIKLYRRNDKRCCEDSQFVQEVTTGVEGNFKFQPTPPGRYWLATTVGGREYKLPFRLPQLNKVNTSCSDQQFEVDDSGKFQVAIMMRAVL